MNGSVPALRTDMVRTLFPGGIPRLWCPLLTHYDDHGELDTRRIAAHIRHMRPWVSAFLAPGSTGDGWEMSEAESTGLLDFLLDEAARQDFSLMIGVLRTGRGEVVPAIRAALARYTGGDGSAAALAARRICGFTVTAPKGADLPQAVIRAELEAIAAMGVPLALYQLPQITENEIDPGTVEALVAARPNIYMLKDTSGEDRVIGAGADLQNLFMVRGAEGDYARWTRANGGPYDGFLLSTANSFARELAIVVGLDGDGDESPAGAAMPGGGTGTVAAGRVGAANSVESRAATPGAGTVAAGRETSVAGTSVPTGRPAEVSARISRAVATVFAAAASLSFGNPFANANKAFDHHFAWGPAAGDHAPPMTHSGERLPNTLIETARSALDEAGVAVGEGYLGG
jgi:dihydrodipicolinate synthase/N-acetylneuraminate lyase